MVLGWLLFGRYAGILAGLILVSSAQFLHEHVGRAAEMEPETSFFYVASMLCIWMARRDGRWLCPLAGAVGLLVMTKGPVVVPVLVVGAAFLALSRPRPRITLTVALASALILAAITLPWHLRQAAVHGDLFTRSYFGTHIWGRFIGRGSDGTTGWVVGITPKPGLWYYGSVVFASMFPWSLLLGPALAAGVWEAAKLRSAQARLVLLWVAAFGLAIGVSTGKLAWYAVPLLPAFSILAAHFAMTMKRTMTPWLFAGLVAAVLVASVLFVPSPDYHPYARHSAAWPEQDPNIVPLWRNDADVLGGAASLAPAVVTLALVAVALGAVFIRRRSTLAQRARSGVWLALLASLGFSGAYGAMLPLEGAERKRDIVVCLEAVETAGVRPEQIALVGSDARRFWDRAVDATYIYNFMGGKIPVRGDLDRVSSDRSFLKSGTLILADADLAKRMSALGFGPPLWRGRQIDAYYQP
jgi:hypothetical protein